MDPAGALREPPDGMIRLAGPVYGVTVISAGASTADIRAIT
jgi:hypothetical protein